jgi:molybdopterin-guanine dinucleotide biosynthesis protein A
VSETISAIVLAGGLITADDPLYPVAGELKKSLLPVAGKPMVQWVIEAIDRATTVSRIILVGLEDKLWFETTKPVSALPDTGGMLTNIKQGLEKVNGQSSGNHIVLLASGDIPTITPEIVDWRVTEALQVGADINYAVVSKETMEARFPRSQRTYVRLRDMQVCGGDLNVLRASIVAHDELWERIIAARKSAWRQVSMLGYDLLLQFLLRRITLEAAGRKVSERLGLAGFGTLSPYAELAMDVDKPAHLEVVEQAMRRRAEE